HDVEVADGDAAVAVAARHLVAQLRPAAAAVAGVRTDRAGRAVVLLDAVAGRQAGKAVALHRPGGAATLAGADHVHPLDFLEDLAGRQLRTDFQLSRPVQAELADVALRLHVRFLRDLHAGGGQLLAAFRFDLAGDVAAFGQGRLVARLVEETELHGVVAVAVLGANLEDGAGADFQDGDGGHFALLVVDLGHTDLQAE